MTFLRHSLRKYCPSLAHRVCTLLMIAVFDFRALTEHSLEKYDEGNDLFSTGRSVPKKNLRLAKEEEGRGEHGRPSP